MNEAAEIRELSERGLAMVAERAFRSQSHQPWEMIRKQLEFMRATVDSGAPPAQKDKDRINLGVLAFREFEDTDPEFADVLFRISYLFDRL